MTTIQLEIAIQETEYGAPSEWRMLCAEGKSDNIIELCSKIPQARINRVLEVGAGEGSILKCLDRKAFANELHALEISSSGVEIIRSLGINSLASCDIFDGYTIPFEDNTFDLVILAHVLEHIEYPRILLREMRRVARYQYIEVPLDMPADLVSSAMMLSYGHVDCFSRSRLRHLLLSENLLPIIDSTKRYHRSAVEYLHFEGNGVLRTPELVNAFRQRHDESNRHFNALSEQEKEKNANVYCVVTQYEKVSECTSRLLSYVTDLLRRGRNGEASLIANDIVKNEYNAAIFYKLGQIYASAKKPDQAREMLEKALEIDENLQPARKLLATLPVTTGL
ncbi:methyltransferase domain-containing protein [Desulfovibrio sp. TomC]|uniref:methyltransferase domain-containing protein n=1 Tax=Desulfovibrio sp. TomC TaxID=1562888 RepID=UPI000573D264|nr:methyltransferase domain-containing protein [Desulfovibrio sp. TomC]KHK02805.1 putative S-adenosyl-L-methionine (SAM)-MTase [Desulfovibrio sp. TomC]